jgi:hypothetical protein
MLDDAAGDVPGDILAANQVVAFAVIHGVELQNARPGGEPFPPVQAVVGAHAANAVLQGCQAP